MNGARNIELQPDGAIVVSGKPISNHAGLLHTDIARHDSNDELDVSSGSGDKLTLPGVGVVQGLAWQPDGKFILVGSATTSTAAAAARRVSILDAFPGRLRRVGCFATDLCAGEMYPLGRPRAVIR